MKLPALPPEAAAGLDAALRHVVRQVVRRHLLGVVDAADDDRLVRVAFQEVDDHLLADARDVDHAPLLAGPRAWPTRTQQELSASFLPSRSQWNCTFTRPYLSVKISSPGRADDDGRLRALHDRLGRRPRRAGTAAPAGCR